LDDDQNNAENIILVEYDKENDQNIVEENVECHPG